jgi:hypothetical protein
MLGYTPSPFSPIGTFPSHFSNTASPFCSKNFSLV